jgi:chromate transporter
MNTEMDQGQGGRTAEPIAMREFLSAFGRIGLLSFGGPAGQIALMHKVLVDEKAWLDEKRFLHALNFCMLLPGPEAMQLATYAGWLKRGTLGGVIAGSLFILPGFLVLLGLSILYALHRDLPLVDGVLFGLKAAVLAIVVQALFKVSARAIKGRESIAVAVAAFVALAVFSLPFPLVILLAALCGWLYSDKFAPAPSVGSIAAEPAKARPGHVGRVIAAGLVLWAAPLALLLLGLGREHVLAAEALFFSQTAIVTFGGAYAVLAYVGQQAVETYQWLTPGEMLTGLGLAETTPGPLILVLVFVGFLGAFRDAGGLDPLLSGLLGALVTLWFTFVPSFLFVFTGAPYMERLRSNRRLSGALAAITAAVVGVIANLSVWFALHVLFARVGEAAIGPARFLLPDIASFDWQAGFIAVLAGIAVLRGWGLGAILAIASIAGIALRSIG